IAPNKYHCSSSHALELTLNTLRTTALVALTKTTSRVSQMTACPTLTLMASMVVDKDRRNFMGPTYRVVRIRSLRTAHIERQASGHERVQTTQKPRPDTL